MFSFGTSNFVKPGMMFGDWGNGWIKTPDTLIDMDFANGRYFGARVNDLITSRNSIALAQRLDGVFESFGVNVPRIIPGRGLLVEEARTNQIRNSSGAGAVAGTPGTAPTNWSAPNPPVAGLSRQVVGVGTENGLPCVDIRWSGTLAAGASNAQLVVFDNFTAVAAAVGQTWTGSVSARVVGGNLTGVTSFGLDMAERDAGGAGLANGVTTIGLDATFQRFSATRTLTNASTAFVIHRIVVTIPNGTTVDFTLRLYAPQLSQAGFSLSPILTTSTALTRPADAVYLPISGIGTQMTLVAEIDPVINSGTSFEILAATSSGSLVNAFRLLATAGRNAQASLRVGDVIISAPATAAQLSTSAVNKIAASVSGSEIAISLNGGTPVIASIGTAAVAPSRLYFGARPDGSFALNTFVRRGLVIPRASSAAEVQALAA